MSGWGAELRRLEAARRRDERAARQRQRELDKALKEIAKLTVLEQARLEVEAHDNAIEVLLSVQKDRTEPLEWKKLASSLPPHEPVPIGRHQFIASLEGLLTHSDESRQIAAETRDEEEYSGEREKYQEERQAWEERRQLAQRILAGQTQAYLRAFAEFSGLSEVETLGTSLQLTVHTPQLVECILRVNGQNIIPKQSKSLTKSGKLSVKPMPLPRFHEIYQDYVCGCILRVAREIFAVLPVRTALVTAEIETVAAASGLSNCIPVLSVAAERAKFDELDFERLDPSDSMELFPHRGDVKASKKTGEFQQIVPLSPSDLIAANANASSGDIAVLRAQIRQLRLELEAASPIPRENTADIATP